MRSLAKLLALFFAASLVLSAAKADDQPYIPVSAWEQHPDGVSLAVSLTKGMEYGEQVTYVIVYVKNTSNTVKGLLNAGRGGFARFFFRDGNGKQIQLGNHDHPDHPERDILESNMRVFTLVPGGTRRSGTDITAEEIILIKTHPVICSFTVDDRATSKGSIVQSLPKMLVNGP